MVQRRSLQKTRVIGQFNSLAQQILSTEGILGLARRTIGRILRKPQHVKLYVLKADDRDMAEWPELHPPSIDLEIKEVTETDDDDIEALVSLDWYAPSRAHVLQFLADGQRCYVAKHKGQVISCYWTKTGVYYNTWLRRSFDLNDNEECRIAAFTRSEFRGMGVLPYLHTESARERAQNCPNLCAFICIEVQNKASLRTSQKVGCKIVGRIGFIEVFGIRFHYLFGRDAFPKTTKRNFLQLLNPRPS